MEKKRSDVIIERFREITENTPEYTKSLQGKGLRVAAYMCTHAPEEMLYAAGVVPVRIVSPHISQAESRGYIHETYCSFSHDCAYQGLQGNYNHVDLIITASSCIHMGEAFNVWVRFAGFQQKSFLIQYPHIIHTKPASGFLVESFGQFKEFIEKFTKRAVTDDDIERAIRVYNRNRRLLKQLWGFLRSDNPALTGAEAATVTLAAQVMDKQECNEMLEELIDSLEGAPAGGQGSVRLMVSGGACDDMAVLHLIENLNSPARVVFLDSCTGARYFWFEVPEGRPDKLLALAEGYIGKIPCPAKDNAPGTGEKKRFRFVQQFIDEFKPDGVVFLYQRFCSPQPLDVVHLKPVLHNLGIASTDLELDTTVPVTQFRNQLEALVEIIKGVTP